MLKPRDTAARAGEWSYTVRNAEPLDYVEQTVYLYDIDLVGNRTADPLSFSPTIDNVPPLIQSPDNVYYEVAAQDGNAWQYELHPVSTGCYRLWVNAVDLAGNLRTAGPFEVEVTPPSQIYLPLVAHNYAVGPDLVVDRIIATSNNVQVVVKDQGDRPVTDEFWVDVYINPTTAPTGVNQTWRMLGTQGLVWGVTAPALPSLQPSGVLTLTVGNAYYWPSESNTSWPLNAGTLVYAQADSANANTTYGTVLENHEIISGEYNNIAIDSTSTTSTARPSDGNQISMPPSDKLPPRP